MKKAILIFLSIVTAVSAAACSLGGDKNINSEEENIFETYDTAQIDERDYDIALITGSDGIDNEENMSLWKSVIAYGDSNSKSYKYYSENDGKNSEALINEAIERNARIVILPDSSYKDTVLKLQNSYPYVSFLMIDTQSDEDFAENVHCVRFREEQTGYLAGYLAVKDGYQSLGFIGDENNDRNMRYLYGMVQGADDATQELRLHGVTIQYSFIGDRADKAKNISKKFYSSGIEAIFVCNNNIAEGVAHSAKLEKKKLICGEHIFSGTEDVSLAYIEHNTIKAVDNTMKLGFDSELNWIGDEGNKDMIFGVDDSCIEISTDDSLWNFNNITMADSEDILTRLANGEIEVTDKTDSMPPIAAVVYSEFE